MNKKYRVPLILATLGAGLLIGYLMATFVGVNIFTMLVFVGICQILASIFKIYDAKMK